MSVSVIIPLYNKASHISRAIDSVLAQTYTDFELIVVDDGSTDGSGDIVRRYTDPRIRLIVQENGGVSVARNRGVAEAKSDLVAFLDGDDEWMPDFLKTVLNLRKKVPEASVWGTAYRIIGIRGRNFVPPFHGRSLDATEDGIIDYFAGASLPSRSPLSSSTILVRKESLFVVGAFPVGVVRNEDYDTWLRLALHFPIAWTPQVKVIVYEDAENRSVALYRGNAPYFASVRAFLAERGPEYQPHAELFPYLARLHTLIYFNRLLAGDYSTIRDIVRDCRRIKGYRLKCFVWRFSVWIPYPLVTFAWKCYSWLRGRGWRMPPIRDICRNRR